jgi:hypothetical protein
MKKLLLLLSLCLLAGASLRAQNRPNPSSKGYFNLTQLSFIMTGKGGNVPAKYEFTPSVANINGYRFNEHLSLGIGVGVTALSYPVFPLFADLRATPYGGGPVFIFKVGYSFANSKKDAFAGGWYHYYTEHKNSGGLMFNPEIGFKIMKGKRSEAMLTAGYWYQRVKSEMKGGPSNQGWDQRSYVGITDLNRFSLGITFMIR